MVKVLLFLCLSYLALLDAYNEEDLIVSLNSINDFNYTDKRIVTTIPTIGVLAKPITCPEIPTDKYDLMIEMRYVNFLMLGGSRVIPIDYNYNQSTLISYSNQVNGILFPGGSVQLINNNSLDIYGTTVQILLKEAIRKNENGLNYPVLGICLGFEAMNIVLANRYDNVLSLCPCEDYSQNLDLTSLASYSKLYKYTKPDIMDSAQNSQLTFNNHQKCVTSYDNHPELNNFFNILSYSKYPEGQSGNFISSIEAKKYPFFGIQFHPEQSMLSFNDTQKINKSFEAIKFGQSISNMFINEARMNRASETPKPADIIYNWKIIMTKELGPVYARPKQPKQITETS